MSDTPRLVMLPLGKLHLSARVRCRESLPAEAISRYSEALQNGAEFPPLTVCHDGALYYVSDGFLRAEAYKRVGRSHVLCEIRPGSLREARMAAAAANARHGEPRSLADRRLAVLRCLEDEEASGWTDAQIAQHVSVSTGLVAGVRRLVAEGNEQQRREAGGRPSNPPTPPAAAARTTAPDAAATPPGHSAAPAVDAADVQTRLYRTLRRVERLARRLGLTVEGAVEKWRADAATGNPTPAKGPARAG